MCRLSFDASGGLLAWKADWDTATAGLKPKSKLRLSIEILREVAREKGGECVSDAYVGSKQKISCRCEAGHEWSAAVSSVIDGRWCRVRGDSQRRSPASRPLGRA